MTQESHWLILKRIAILQNIENFQTIDQVAAKIDMHNHRIFIAGNGGSAAIASHFTQGLVDCGLDAISLVDCVSLLTALSNDCGYENVFEKQLENCLTLQDIVILISASGNSQNIIKAAQFARTLGALVIGFTGFDGGALKGLSNLNIHVETKIGEYATVEDIHMIVCHVIEELVKQRRRYSLAHSC